jgi:hypothetical protein
MKCSLLKTSTLSVFLWIATTANAAQITPTVDGRVYVNNAIATTDSSGSSWTNAVPELADVLKEAQTNSGIKEIWVAAGTYKPLYAADFMSDNPSTNPRDRAFVLDSGVKLYGGFGGTESTIDERVPENITVLSGDIDGDGILNNGNVYHVVMGAYLNSQTLLDRFTITGGNANAPQDWGSITINGYEQDVTRDRGGALVLAQSECRVNNVIFTNNAVGGGADGAAILLYYSGDIFTNCKIINNQNGSGTLYIRFQAPNNKRARIINCLFSGNSVASDGAIRLYDSPKIDLINTTVSGNKRYGIVQHGGILNLYNTVVYGNEYNGSDGEYTSYNSLVQGVNNDGNNNLPGFINPQFTDPKNPGTATADGDYTTSNCSPIVKMGDTAIYNELARNYPDIASYLQKDLAGNPRFVNGKIDIGAYQNQTTGELPTLPKPKITATFGASGGTLQNGSYIYNDSIQITLSCDTLDADIYFFINGENMQQYSEPFWIYDPGHRTISAYASKTCHTMSSDSIISVEKINKTRGFTLINTLPYQTIATLNSEEEARIMHYFPPFNGCCDFPTVGYKLILDRDTTIKITVEAIGNMLNEVFLLTDSIVSATAVPIANNNPMGYDVVTLTTTLKQGTYYLYISNCNNTTGANNYFLSIDYDIPEKSIVWKPLPFPLDTANVLFNSATAPMVEVPYFSGVYPAYLYSFTIDKDSLISITFSDDLRASAFLIFDTSAIDFYRMVAEGYGFYCDEIYLSAGTYYILILSPYVGVNFNFNLSMDYSCTNTEGSYTDVTYGTEITIGTPISTAGSYCGDITMGDLSMQGYTVNLIKGKSYMFYYEVAFSMPVMDDVSVGLVILNDSLTGVGEDDVVTNMFREFYSPVQHGGVSIIYTADSTASYKLLTGISSSCGNRKWTNSIIVTEMPPYSDSSYKTLDYNFALTAGDTVGGTVSRQNKFVNDAAFEGNYRGYKMYCGSGTNYIITVTVRQNAPYNSDIVLALLDGENVDYETDKRFEYVTGTEDWIEKTFSVSYAPTDTVLNVLFGFALNNAVNEIEYTISVVEAAPCVQMGELNYSQIKYDCEAVIIPDDTVTGIIGKDVTAFVYDYYWGNALGRTIALDSGKSYYFKLTLSRPIISCLDIGLVLFKPTLTGDFHDDALVLKDNWNNMTKEISVSDIYTADTTADYKLLLMSYFCDVAEIAYTLSVVEINGNRDYKEISYPELPINTLTQGVMSKTEIYNLAGCQYDGRYGTGYSVNLDSGVNYMFSYTVNGGAYMTLYGPDTANVLFNLDNGDKLSHFYQADTTGPHFLLLQNDFDLVNPYSIIVREMPSVRDSVPNYLEISVPFAEQSKLIWDKQKWIRSIDDFPVNGYKFTLAADTSITVKWNASSPIFIGIYFDSTLENEEGSFTYANSFREISLPAGTYYAVLGAPEDSTAYGLNIRYTNDIAAITIAELIAGAPLAAFDSIPFLRSLQLGSDPTKLTVIDDNASRAFGDFGRHVDAGQKRYAAAYKINIDASNGFFADDGDWGYRNRDVFYLLYKKINNNYYLTAYYSDYYLEFYQGVSTGEYAIVIVGGVQTQELFQFDIRFANFMRAPIKSVAAQPASIAVSGDAAESQIALALLQQITVTNTVTSEYAMLFGIGPSFSQTIPVGNWTIYADSAVSILSAPAQYYYLPSVNNRVVVKLLRNVSGVEILPDDADTITLRQGSTVALTAHVLPDNAKNKLVNWYSTNTNVVSVTGMGVVTGISGGVAYIIAATAEGGYSDTAIIKVAPKSNIADLRSLDVYPGILSPAFTANTTAYTVNVPHSVSEITITAAKRDTLSYLSGTGTFALEQDTSIFNVAVMSEDSTVTKTYRIKVIVDELSTITEVRGIKADFKAYPNPSNGVFAVSVPFDGVVTAYNMQGFPVLKTTLKAGENHVLRLPKSGLYILRIIGINNGRTATERVIVR